MVEFFMLIAGFLPALGDNYNNNVIAFPSVIFCSKNRIEFYDSSAKLVSVSAITSDLSKKYCSRPNGRKSI